jgi:hypothetical protein
MHRACMGIIFKASDYSRAQVEQTEAVAMSAALRQLERTSSTKDAQDMQKRWELL